MADAFPRGWRVSLHRARSASGRDRCGSDGGPGWPGGIDQARCRTLAVRWCDRAGVSHWVGGFADHAGNHVLRHYYAAGAAVSYAGPRSIGPQARPKATDVLDGQADAGRHARLFSTILEFGIYE